MLFFLIVLLIITNIATLVWGFLLVPKVCKYKRKAFAELVVLISTKALKDYGSLYLLSRAKTKDKDDLYKDTLSHLHLVLYTLKHNALSYLGKIDKEKKLVK